MKTWAPRGSEPAEQRKWYAVDASGVALGRVCTRVANLLTGKNKPAYTPHVDMGDHVIVVNAAKVKLTGRKASDKIYYSHSKYPGSLKQMTAGEKLKRSPKQLIRDSVRGMLPKTKLGRKMLSKLKVYAGPEHPHEAQRPEIISLTDLR